jgi:two-component system OmpR family sensor kinase
VSLRARLAVVAVGLVAVGLAVAGVVTYGSLKTFLIDRVDAQLRTSQPFAFGILVRDGGDGGGFVGPAELSLPFGTYAAVLDRSGAVAASTSVPAGAAFPEPELRSVEVSDEPPFVRRPPYTTGSVDGSLRYRVQVSPLPDASGTLVVAIPLTDVEATLGRLVVVELLVGASVLVLVALAAWWVVRLGLRPLEGIGETAGAIAAGDLTRRVEPTDERTEVGRLGRSLNAMLAQIEVAFEERRASESRLRRFVADASHELRTPLTSIRGYAELFRRGADERPEDLEKSMARIEAEASRMGVLVDDLLLLARLDQGRPLEREPVDLGRVAEDAAESARAVEPGRSVDVLVEGEVTLVGDEGRLRQILDNLLDNVRVHTPAGTPAHVRVAREGDVVAVTVRDEGPGLDGDAADRAFERFYRGDPVRSRATGGAGLGLSIVAAIVEAHGGTVTASPGEGSGLDAGAVFEVRIPVPSEDEAPPGEGEPAPDATA